MLLLLLLLGGFSRFLFSKQSLLSFFMYQNCQSLLFQQFLWILHLGRVLLVCIKSMCPLKNKCLYVCTFQPEPSLLSQRSQEHLANLSPCSFCNARDKMSIHSSQIFLSVLFFKQGGEGLFCANRQPPWLSHLWWRDGILGAKRSFVHPMFIICLNTEELSNLKQM